MKSEYDGRASNAWVGMFSEAQQWLTFTIYG